MPITTLRARGITPLRAVIGLAILAALVLGSVWVGGGFSASSHEVSVQITGGEGAVYQIQGGPDGDTGPVSLSGGFAAKTFATDKAAEDLALTVTVTAPAGVARGCSINYDGRALAVSGSERGTCRVGG